MTILVCLDEKQDTWWHVSNTLGRVLLDRARDLAKDDETRQVIADGRSFQCLDFFALDSPLKEQVWTAVENAAKRLSQEPPPSRARWPSGWAEHVVDLWREMEARRFDPDRPGAWP